MQQRYYEIAVPVAVNGRMSKHLVREFNERIDAARAHCLITQECALLGLSARHIAQRFRRYKERKRASE